MHDDITDIPGIRVGHDTNLEAGTGCTVILCDAPAMGGIDVRGGAPATRETDLLRPMTLVEGVNAIVLTGGSAFGLDAASGVTDWVLHDLRRTLVSSWAALGIRLEVTEKYINHISGTHGGIVGVYQRHSFMPEMREAVGKWETKLTVLLGVQEAADAIDTVVLRDATIDAQVKTPLLQAH